MASGTGPDLYGMTTGSMMNQYAKFSVDMKETADQYCTRIVKTQPDSCHGRFHFSS